MREVSSFPDDSETIADSTPLTVLEVGGQAEIVLSFVISTYSPAHFGLVFEREEDSWTAVFKEFYETEKDAKGGFQAASDAIMEYWEQRTTMTKSDEIETPDGVTFDEMTAGGIDEDAYFDYFR
ncbi:hypothetical protein [Haloferax sp. ATB1]|nr:hypothetical protein [Haloferax sp. ATB1]